VKLDVADDIVTEEVSPKKTRVDEFAISRSLSHPTNFGTLESFVASKKKILVVVNDKADTFSNRAQ
jgi:nickel-dependent lactate racemase